MQLAVMNREQRIGIRPQTDTLTLLMSSADLCGWRYRDGLPWTEI